MPPYLRLCMRTWVRHLGEDRVAVLDYSKLGGIVDEAALDIPTLRTLPLPMQKDAVSVIVLNKLGGVFLDADTLVTGNLTSILALLQHSEMVMFGRHLAFLSARPGAQLLIYWQDRIQKRLRAFKDAGDGGAQPPWDFLGNSLLAESMT